MNPAEPRTEPAKEPEPERKPPYPWCAGAPVDRAVCTERGYCPRDPNCGE
jgi:hypothetical protein